MKLFLTILLLTVNPNFAKASYCDGFEKDSEYYKPCTHGYTVGVKECKKIKARKAKSVCRPYKHNDLTYKYCKLGYNKAMEDCKPVIIKKPVGKM